MNSKPILYTTVEVLNFLSFANKKSVLDFWEHWGLLVPRYDYPRSGQVEFERILVPNQDNVTTEYLVSNVCRRGRSVLLFGESGTAKTAIINKYLQSFSEETDIARNCNFSSATTPLTFQVW